MSILTSSSSNSVSRGFSYYKSDTVKSLTQLNDNEYEGYVDGSLKEAYYVRINLDHPKKSYCDCPHANGHVICKHMVALYFSIYPEEAEEYEAWLESSCDEENYNEFDEYDDYDDYEYDGFPQHKHSFEKPLFFNEVLNNFINELSIDDLKELLKKELLKDEEEFYHQHLEKNYKKYLNEIDSSLAYLDTLNIKIKESLQFYDYEYNDFSKPIFSSHNIKKIRELYTNASIHQQISKLILNPKLADFSDYQSLIPLIKEQHTKREISIYIEKLQNHLNSLKHYNIRDTQAKSNILITIYLLGDPTIKEQALSLLKNAKYIEYIEFVIKNSRNIQNLYSEFKKQIEKNYLKYKLHIPDVFTTFVVATDYRSKHFFYDYCLYSFLCKEDTGYINILERNSTTSIKEKFIKDIETKTKKVITLSKLYSYYSEEEKLWNLINCDDYNYLLIQYIDILKKKYNKELYQYFINQFYSILKIEKSRENYKNASAFINAISRLTNGTQLVDSIKTSLKSSEYKKCTALFEEINNAIH